MAYRHTAVFHADWRTHCTPLDRNQKARIMVAAEGLERRTKLPGRRNGLLGYVGLAVLRTLLLTFHNSSNGLCCPGYATLQARTGLCRQSIANGIARLERTGILRIVRRLCRQTVQRFELQFVTTTQATSLYAIGVPGAWAGHLPLPPAKPAPFPEKRQLDLLTRLGALWKVHPSLRRREEPQNPVKIIAGLMRPK